MPPSFQEDHISQIPAIQLLQRLGYTYLRSQEAFVERGGKYGNVLLEGVLGKSFDEEVNGVKKSPQLHYIDWENPKNNVYHVCDELEVSRAEAPDKTRRLDIVCYVNGIPLVVIECKRPDAKDPMGSAISQQLRNQRRDEIPGLFVFSQVLLALSKNEAKFATTGTPGPFWSRWREAEITEAEMEAMVNLPLSPSREGALFQDRYEYLIDAVAEESAERRMALEPSIPDPRIVLVTDRFDLDDQIWKTFLRTGKTPHRARTGSDLLRLLKSPKASVITTVINKFMTAVKKQTEITGRDIFVLVDEGHRTQYGTVHAQMRRVLPNACYVGFTGTPLMGKEKHTAQKFGGLIDTYSIEDAVDDEAVVPLLYEGRLVHQEVNEPAMDAGFNIVAEPLGEYQVRDLKRKFASTDQLNKAESRQWHIAHDISEHFDKNWKGTPFKGQLAVDSKRSAIRYKQFLDEFGKVTSEVLISAPDTLEDNEDIYEGSDDLVQRFWKRILAKYGDEKTYNEQLIEAFKYGEVPEIIIVVHKLLTGFDAPRNAVLYVDRKLKDHTLLQAIARVNRLYEGKDYGFIVDYYGIIQELGDAMDVYSTLSDFEKEDLVGAVRNVREEMASLPPALCGDGGFLGVRRSGAQAGGQLRDQSRGGTDHTADQHLRAGQIQERGGEAAFRILQGGHHRLPHQADDVGEMGRGSVLLP